MQPGGERIVTGSDGSVWYSPDHYKQFIEVK
jgi:guanyl-specific ribonuclease Sa